MPFPTIPLWKEAPFLRLLPPLIAGIIIQWYIPLPLTILWLCIATSTLSLIVIGYSRITSRFNLRHTTALLFNIALLSTGTLTIYLNHPNNNKNSLTSIYQPNQTLLATIQEPLIKKPRSYKTTATVNKIYINNKPTPASGNIIIYFSPNIPTHELTYGSIILINKRLTPVKNTGNPGAFNYQQHCIFNQITHQVFLQPNEFFILPGKETRGLKSFIIGFRQKIINVLDQYIKPQKQNALAEALLIGYKDDLDKDLVQAYANTGVVHVIAISGLHLGIIYWLLGLIFSPIKKHRAGKWFYCALVLCGLWLFSLMAGAGPSVIRSAVMFSFIAIGEASSKRSSIYNNLAASAFLLLCYNPFWLWDAGFQLSYGAVLSIVIFFKPVYNLLYVRNKLLDAIWKLSAVTLAAQVLTTPISIYHFHQFPTFFLLSNMIAVPLSSLLLIGEIILVSLSFIPFLATAIGNALSFLITLLNQFIENINSLPFSTWDSLSITFPQFMLLTAFIATLSMGLMHQNKPAFKLSVACMIAFTGLRSISFIAANNQHKLIVYNIPQKQAIEIINGRNAYFTGDEAVMNDQFLQNFHIKPAHINHRIISVTPNPSPLFSFAGKKMMIADKTFHDLPADIPLDVLILSHNTPIELLETAQVKQVVADASNNPRQLNRWKQACQALHIPFHSVVENGAFVLDI